jgi:hypothetical protein
MGIIRNLAKMRPATSLIAVAPKYQFSKYAHAKERGKTKETRMLQAKASTLR